MKPKAQVYFVALILPLFFFSGALYAKPPSAEVLQQGEWTLTGTTKNAKGEAVIGVNVIVLGTVRGVLSDFEGKFSIKVSKGDILEFSLLGMETVRVTIDRQTTLNVVMKEQATALEEVQVVSFGTQKKESVIADIATVKPSELKIPSSNLTTALAGRIPGIISLQSSGEPGFGGGGTNRADNANFFVRGVASFGPAGSRPLVLIDGVQLDTEDLARLTPDDIETFSVMKDASAVAIYGSRGANGVIYVTTKTGEEGRPKFMIRQEVTVSTPTQTIEIADPLTFVRATREATLTRNPQGVPTYSLARQEALEQGKDPILYPQNDWLGELTKPSTVNTRTNFNMRGGGKVAQYYISMIYTRDNGLLKVPRVSNFNNNIAFSQYQLRSNISINVTETTKLKFNFIGNYDDYNGPPRSGGEFYTAALRADPVLFRPFYEKQGDYLYSKHILFGNAYYGSTNSLYYNPYADLVSGYRQTESSKTIAQLELNQDLSFITKGFSFNFVGNITRQSASSITRSYNPFYYSYGPLSTSGTLGLTPLNETTGTEFLNFTRDYGAITSSYWVQATFNYDRQFFNDKVSVNALLLGNIQNITNNQGGDLQASLPTRNLVNSGRVSLGYDHRYFTEFSFGYNGSERFNAKNRFGFFPSLAVGWVISNEKFMKPLNSFVKKLKLKASYGLSGNSAIGNYNDRFFFLSNVNLNNAGRTYSTGTDFSVSRPGITVSRYENPDITWEIGRKANVGLEFNVLNGLEGEVNVFQEVRSNILTNNVVVENLGFEAAIQGNYGVARVDGIDALLNYTFTYGKTGWLKLISNFTYAKGVVIKAREPDYSRTPWLSIVGQAINQPRGFVAERLFVDDEEVANSPRQDFGGVVQGGDIKYKDINGDGIINSLDAVPIGNPTVPFITYGFGVSTGVRGFDFSVFFQGIADVSFFTLPAYTAPFTVRSVGGQIVSNALLKAYSDSHWSETNRDVYALWPRYSLTPTPNNSQTSTWYMQDGSFVRLKTLEFGYSLPQKIINKWKISTARFYFSGTNLLTFSNFKLWDPEMGSNGFGYPVQRIFNLGFTINF